MIVLEVGINHFGKLSEANSYLNFFLVILINVIFLLPFAILIFFNNLKNLYLNFKNELKIVWWNEIA